MTSIFSYLLTFLGILFWFFRAIVTLCYQIDKPLFATPINVELEILLLFLTLPCILLVMKRNLIGATLYWGLYASYFGTALYEGILEIQAGATIVNLSNLVCVLLGVLIPTFTFFDILFNKNRSGYGKDKKTDWYYNNEKYDREFDERADRNQYRL